MSRRAFIAWAIKVGNGVYVGEPAVTLFPNRDAARVAAKRWLGGVVVRVQVKLLETY